MIKTRLYPSAALHARVAHEIGRRIVSGSLAEGELLPRETELSEEFGASRQAIREALKVLAAKGLVASRRRTGTFVTQRSSWSLLDPDVLAWHPAAELGSQFLKDLVELRCLIEPAAAEFAAIRGDPERVAGIGAALDRLRDSTADVTGHAQADAEFHLAIFAACGNALMERLSTILEPLLRTSLQLMISADPAGRAETETSITRHAAIYEAIVAHDGPAARRAMERVLDVASGQIEHLNADQSEEGSQAL